MRRRHIAFGDGDETGQPRFRGQQIVATFGSSLHIDPRNQWKRDRANRQTEKRSPSPRKIFPKLQRLLKGGGKEWPLPRKAEKPGTGGQFVRRISCCQRNSGAGADAIRETTERGLEPIRSLRQNRDGLKKWFDDGPIQGFLGGRWANQAVHGLSSASRESGFPRRARGFRHKIALHRPRSAAGFGMVPRSWVRV